jgi:hypothetical protein
MALLGRCRGRRGGVGGAVSKAVAIAILAVSCLAGAAHAGEPDGSVAIRYEWLDPKLDPAGLPRLRVTVSAFEPLTGLSLLAKVPAGISILADRLVLAGAGAASELPQPGEPFLLGDLERGAAAVVEFVVELPPGAGGIGSLTVEAATPSGKAVREGAGVPIGVVGVEPVLRNGALEFPAAPPPAKGP